MSDLQELERALAEIKRGPAGRDGRDGRDGLDGVPGSPGPTGASGAKGLDGLHGKDGAPGIDGKDGRDGIDGKDGRDGIDGKDGAPGRDGVGIKGKDGARGEAGPIGPPGPIGPMPQHEWEGTKLRFEIRPGRWGQSVDLQGPAGKPGRVVGGGAGAALVGVGVPAGGTTGQVLAKASGTNYDVAWADAGDSGGAGLTKISSGSITSPVVYFDIALPAGYVSFDLELIDFLCSTAESLAFGLSENGGVSFHQEDTAYVRLDNYSPSGAPTFVTSYQEEWTVGALKESLVNTTGTSRSTLRINPGSASKPATVHSTGFAYAGTQFRVGETVIRLLSGTARQNAIRITTLGNADVSPPTTTETLTAGHWILYGHQV